MNWDLRILRDISWTDLENEQAKAVSEVSSGSQTGVLLFSEPRSTFTCGRSGTPSDLLWSKDELEKRGIETAQVSRGGKWTYHGPGQLLLYPIVSLKSLGLHSKAAREFVETLRKAFLIALRQLGAEAEAVEEPYGIAHQGRKLVSFGIDLHSGIVSHGVALYLRDQRSPFQGIHPCGQPSSLPTSLPTSLEEMGFRVTFEDMVSQLLDPIKKGFKTP
jgi:lipoyl(octanoyl) transferase